jgi:hypothetical protein
MGQPATHIGNRRAAAKDMEIGSSDGLDSNRESIREPLVPEKFQVLLRSEPVSLANENRKSILLKWSVCDVLAKSSHQR